MATITAKRHEAAVQRQYDLNSYCGNSDGASFCNCQCEFQDTLSCMFYGRNLEPLAFSLTQETIILQDECTLINGLPREIRQIIWEYALKDTPTTPAHSTFKWRGGRFGSESGHKLPTSDIAFGLLRTCKAIYLETYTIPLQINSHVVYGFQGPFRPDLKLLAPWQAALIQRLDISLAQMALERGELRNWLTHWHAKKRHNGAYIAPLFKEVYNKMTGFHLQPFPFDITSLAAEHDGKDGMEVTLPIPPSAPRTFYDKTTNATHFSARVMVARPLTHLTLRLCHKDWWSWSNDPEKTTYPAGQLALDPAVGLVDGSVWRQPNVGLMHQLAEKRRAGEEVSGNGTWGAIVGRLPDLKELTLVLETFDVKQDQLGRTVECATTWKFPIEDTPFALVWDGKVEDASWTAEADEAGEKDREAAAGEEEQDDEYDETDEEEEKDDYGSEEEEDNESVEIERPETPPPSWFQIRKRFEVRVVRFVRRKM